MEYENQRRLFCFSFLHENKFSFFDQSILMKFASYENLL